MIDIVQEKTDFLRDMASWKDMQKKKTQAARNSVNAALLRGSVYKHSKFWRNEAFKKDWMDELLEKGEYYPISKEIDHIKMIESIALSLSKKHGHILCQDKMRIGTSQKALNLYLKYLWCFKQILYTPHCPLDSDVLNEASRVLNDACLRKTKWSKIDTAKRYTFCIGRCKDAAKENEDISNLLNEKDIRQEERLAAWELIVWNALHPCP